MDAFGEIGNRYFNWMEGGVGAPSIWVTPHSREKP